MANCPNCGSEDIQLQEKKEVNWGRAAVGWALFGVVGGAVGAVTGDEKHSNVCLECGTSWKAVDLYNLKQTFKTLTNIEINLKHEKDRWLLNEFITQISPYLQAIPDEEKKTKKLLKEKEGDKEVYQGQGCLFGMVLGMGGCLMLADSDGAFMCFILLSLLGWGAGFLLDSTRTKQVEKELGQLKLERERTERKTKRQLEIKINQFKIQHNL